MSVNVDFYQFNFLESDSYFLQIYLLRRNFTS